MIAVFDFDGTIVSKDTGFQFCKWLIKGSAFRTLACFMVLPIGGPLVLLKSTRRLGISIFSYIATSCQKKSLFRLRAEFLNDYFNTAGVAVFCEAVNSILKHQSENVQVIVISGCPEWLLKGALKYIGLHNVTAIGSKMTLYKSGMLFKEHCNGKSKVKMALDRGLRPIEWYYGYSDSLLDRYWLIYCREVNFINTSTRTIAKFKQTFKGKVIARTWA